MYPEDWGRCHSIVVVLGAGSYGNRKQLCISGFLILTSWKGGTWNELNRTKVYSISMKLNSAKVGSPLYLNSSHVVRVKPLHSSLHQKRSPSLKKNSFLCQFHFVFLNDLTINVLLFYPRVV